MNEHWRSFLESTDAHFSESTGEILDFGDASGELHTAGQQTVLAPLTHLAVLDVAGDDAGAFLHNQFTSDITALAPDQARHAGWCTAKGRLLASFIVRRGAAGYRLLLAENLLAFSEKRLRMYVLRAKVTLTAQPECVLLGLAGAQLDEALAAAGLRAPGDVLHSLQQGPIEVLRLDAQRVIVICPLAQAADVWLQLTGKARPVGLPVWRWLDVENALPLVTQATQEAFVPQMLDLEQIGGLSFNKGCYPGQEIVARTQYLGKVKRRLFRVDSPQELAAGRELFSPDNPDQAVGQIVTGAPAPGGGFAGLAVIQVSHAATVRLGARDGVPLAARAVHPEHDVPA